MKNTLPKIFQNKYFLYTVTLLAIGNIMGYLANEKYDCVSFFLAVGLLSSYFSKNMTVVLLIAMGTTALFCNKNLTEGFKEGHPQPPPPVVQQNNSGAPTQVVSNSVQQASPETVAANKASEGGAAAAATTNLPALSAEKATQDSTKEAQSIKEPLSPANLEDFCYRASGKVANDKMSPKRDKWVVVKDVQGVAKKMKRDQCKVSDNKYWGGACYNRSTEQDPWAVMNDTTVERCMELMGSSDSKLYKWCPAAGCASMPNPGFSNMKKKSGTESKEARVDGVDESVGDRIDYANTMKQSMDNLQEMLGADGMKGLAAETKKLVAQQKELVDSLGQMAPVLNSAKSTLDSLNLPDMKGITNILGVLKGGK